MQDAIKIWNTSDCASYLGRSEGAVRNLVLRRAIPYRKVGGRLVFLKREIDDWIETAPGLRVEDVKN